MCKRCFYLLCCCCCFRKCCGCKKRRVEPSRVEEPVERVECGLEPDAATEPLPETATPTKKKKRSGQVASEEGPSKSATCQLAPKEKKKRSGKSSSEEAPSDKAACELAPKEKKKRSGKAASEEAPSDKAACELAPKKKKKSGKVTSPKEEGPSAECELDPKEKKTRGQVAPEEERQLEPSSPPKRRASVPIVRKDHYSSPVVDVNADPCLDDRIVVKGRSSSYTVKRYRSTVCEPNAIANILKKVGDEDRPKKETIMEVPERSKFLRKASKDANVRKGPKQAYDCLLDEPPEDYDPYSRRRDCIDEGEPERREYIPYVRQCIPKDACELSPECDDLRRDDCTDPCVLESSRCEDTERRYQRNECDRTDRRDVCDRTDRRDECDRTDRRDVCDRTDRRDECDRTDRRDVCEDICVPGPSNRPRSDGRTVCDARPGRQYSDARAGPSTSRVCDEDARSGRQRYSDAGPTRNSRSDDGRGTVCDEDAKSGRQRYSDAGPTRYSRSDDGRGTVRDEDAKSGRQRYSDAGPTRYSRSDDGRGTVRDEDAKSGRQRYSDAGPSRYSRSDDGRATEDGRSERRSDSRDRRSTRFSRSDDARVHDEDARFSDSRAADDRDRQRRQTGSRSAEPEGRNRRSTPCDIRESRTETKIEYGSLHTAKAERKSTDKTSVSFDKIPSLTTLDERKSIRASTTDSGRGFQLTPFDSQKVYTSGSLSKKQSRSIMDIKEVEDPFYPKKTMSDDSGVQSSYAKKENVRKKTEDPRRTSGKKSASNDSIPRATEKIVEETIIRQTSYKIEERALSDDSGDGRAKRSSSARKSSYAVPEDKRTSNDSVDRAKRSSGARKSSYAVAEDKRTSDDSDGRAKRASSDRKSSYAVPEDKERALSDDLVDEGPTRRSSSAKKGYATKIAEDIEEKSLDDCVEPEKTKKSDCPSWPGPSCLKPGEKPKVSYIDRKSMMTPQGECPRWVTRTEGLGVIRSAKDPCENIDYSAKKKDPLAPTPTLKFADPETTED